MRAFNVRESLISLARLPELENQATNARGSPDFLLKRDASSRGLIRWDLGVVLVDCSRPGSSFRRGASDDIDFSSARSERINAAVPRTD